MEDRKKHTNSYEFKRRDVIMLPLFVDDVTLREVKSQSLFDSQLGIDSLFNDMPIKVEPGDETASTVTDVDEPPNEPTAAKLHKTSEIMCLSSNKPRIKKTALPAIIQLPLVKNAPERAKPNLYLSSDDDEEEIIPEIIKFVPQVASQKIKPPASFLLLCRICAKKDFYCTSIFDDFGKNLQLPSKINKYLPIQVNESDTFPHKICRQCMTNFLAFDTMYRSSLQAETIFKSMLSGERGTSLDDLPSNKVDHIDNEPYTPEPPMELNQSLSEDVPAFNISPPDGQVSTAWTILEDTEFGECYRCKCVFLNKSLPEHKEMCTAMAIPENPPPSPKEQKTKTKVRKFDIARLKQLVFKPEKEEELTLNQKKGIRKAGPGNVSFINGRYVCNMCHKIYGNLADFTTHRRRECPYNHFVCEECPATFKVDAARRNHMRLSHPVTADFSCDLCRLKFPNKFYLEKHIKYHFAERTFQCELCPKAYKRGAHLRYHQQVAHKKPVSIAKNTKFICGNCNGQFSNESRLRIHLKRHEGVKSHICEKCGRSFFSTSALKAHLSRPVCIKGREKKLPHERKRISTNYTPEQISAMQNMNAKERQKFCSKIYKANYLKAGKFTCEVCSKAFGTKAELTHHSDKHTNEKRYACTLCGNAYKYSANLRRHMADHGERKLSCSRCERRFALSSELRRHMLSHTSERPFSCHCGKTFARKGDLNVHRRKVHNEQVGVPRG